MLPACFAASLRVRIASVAILTGWVDSSGFASSVAFGNHTRWQHLLCLRLLLCDLAAQSHTPSRAARLRRSSRTRGGGRIPGRMPAYANC